MTHSGAKRSPAERGSRVAAGHHGVTRSALDARRRVADARRRGGAGRGLLFATHCVVVHRPGVSSRAPAGFRVATASSVAGVRWGARRARSARSVGPHRGGPRPNGAERRLDPIEVNAAANNSVERRPARSGPTLVFAVRELRTRPFADRLGERAAMAVVRPRPPQGRPVA